MISVPASRIPYSGTKKVQGRYFNNNKITEGDNIRNNNSIEIVSLAIKLLEISMHSGLRSVTYCSCRLEACRFGGNGEMARPSQMHDFIFKFKNYGLFRPSRPPTWVQANHPNRRLTHVDTIPFTYSHSHYRRSRAKTARSFSTQHICSKTSVSHNAIYLTIYSHFVERKKAA